MNKAYANIIKGLLSCLLFAASCSANDSLDWSFDGSYRLRFEYLNNTFRSTSAHNDDQLIAARLLAGIKLNYNHLTARVEIQDSRAWLDNEATPLGTDDVNTLEPLQYWLGWESDQVTLRVGRQTLDIGSRRFVARNRFRNTLNAFSGIYGQVNVDAFTVQSFYFNPVMRLPDGYADLDSNAAQMDHPAETIFKGIHVDYLSGSHHEVFYYDFKSQQTPAHLKTAGFRISQLSNSSSWTYDLEAAYQFGSHQQQDVYAQLLHAELGYQLTLIWPVRFTLLADYASGDKNPDDNKYTQFNTLSGARRFDFGPTGIYGAFARTNIISPGLQASFKPAPLHNTRLVYRAIWFDAASNTSNSARKATAFIGHQVEFRWRYDLTEAIRLESGGAYLFKQHETLLSPQRGDSTYWYSQATLSF